MQVMHNAHTATAFPIHSRSLNSETGCQLNKHFDCWTVTGQIYNATHNGPTSNTFRINGEYLISSLIFPSKYFCEEGEVRFVSMANSNGHRRISFDRRFRNCCKWFCTRRNIFLPKKNTVPPLSVGMNWRTMESKLHGNKKKQSHTMRLKR